jgi:hypothetical protein
MLQIGHPFRTHAQQFLAAENVFRGKKLIALQRVKDGLVKNLDVRDMRIRPGRLDARANRVRPARNCL